MKNKKCPERKFCFSYKENACEGCAVGDEILKQHKRIDRLKKQKETLTIQRNAWALTAKAMENKWISVDERLPSMDELCLLSMENRITKYRWVVIGYYHTNYDEYVTHWMPLPQPPMMKGGE